MKIIVMSDSHGDQETVKAVSSLSGDATFHCGDSELSFDDPLLENIHTVRGNCDLDSRFPSSVLVEVGNKKVLAVHGHEHDVKRSLMMLYYTAKEQGADIVLFGHSHLYGAEMKDSILFLNPGSTRRPRGGREATYAVIEWDETVRVSFCNIKGELVDSVEMKNLL
ncbi:phosphoesterase [Bacillus sp. OxB-1]|uniref:metallophosphoesterase n=1 Tax=Bacillus sp. (strain OxB-1) TaxID=98228 RepID=UPI0005820B48|nr:metallophosphoesterase [Bacillus sp. OxB-1]BAQ11659.1 phosphoesterase [Bacillus sp. OxB-1]